MTIYENILRLTSYALNNSLITKEDIIYTQNKLLELFRLDGFETPVAPELPQVKTEDLEEIPESLRCFHAWKMSRFDSLRHFFFYEVG